MPPAPDPALIAEIMASLEKLSERFEPDNNAMKQWMTQHFHNPALAELLQDSTIIMLRVLDAIGRSEPVNGITISKQFHIPRGSVSKTTRRLAARKLITTETLPNNKKEILFRTTPLGRELYLAHRAFDEQMGQGFVRFLQRYEPAELQLILRILKDVSTTSFLEIGTQDREE